MSDDTERQLRERLADAQAALRECLPFVEANVIHKVARDLWFNRPQKGMDPLLVKIHAALEPVP